MSLFGRNIYILLTCRGIESTALGKYTLATVSLSNITFTTTRVLSQY